MKKTDYYKSIRVNNFWKNNYIQYKSKGDENIMLSVKKNNKIRPYLTDTVNENLTHRKFN